MKRLKKASRFAIPGWTLFTSTSIEADRYTKDSLHQPTLSRLFNDLLGQIAKRRSLAECVVGVQEPGYTRVMGMKIRAKFTETLAAATRYNDHNPYILALPNCLRTPAVHVLMAAKHA